MRVHIKLETGDLGAHSGVGWEAQAVAAALSHSTSQVLGQIVASDIIVCSHDEVPCLRDMQVLSN